MAHHLTRARHVCSLAYGAPCTIEERMAIKTTDPTRDPTRDTRERVRKLYDDGFSVRDIAKLVDISTQRVYQHLEALKLDPPKTGAAS